MTSIKITPRYIDHLWYPILVKISGYHLIVEMQGKVANDWVYRIWLIADKWKQSAYQEATELASLEHLRKLGVRI